MQTHSHNTFRRFVQLLLVVLVIGAGALGSWWVWGREGNADPNRPIHLTVTVPGGNQKRLAIFDAVVREFEKTHPDVKVSVQGIPGGRYYQKVLVMLASRIGPDLMWMGQSFSEFADRGVFLDITSHIENDETLNLTEYNPQALSWYRYDKKQYAIPFGIDMRVMVYNKDLFDEAHLPYPDDDWTFEEFLAVCKKLTVDRDGDGRIDQYGYQGPIELSLFGGKIVEPDGSAAACNCPETIAYIRTALDMFKKYRVSPTPKEQMQQTGLDGYSIFRQRKNAIMMFATWDFASMKKQFANLRWDIVLNPKVRRRGQWVSSQAFMIHRDTKYPDLCWELYRVLSGPAMQERMAFMTIPTHLPTLQKAIANHRGAPKNVAALEKALDRLYPTPRVPHLQELINLYSIACQSVWTGEATPEEAMRTAERQINRTLRRRKR
ncbi:MAG: sugar ABC transporter substrate-binding protein [Phycisphaerae bacterium]|nr:sugar ABC transporter substrate-binding protein [Phycisphaerae bacterium]